MPQVYKILDQTSADTYEHPPHPPHTYTHRIKEVGVTHLGTLELKSTNYVVCLVLFSFQCYREITPLLNLSNTLTPVIATLLL